MVRKHATPPPQLPQKEYVSKIKSAFGTSVLVDEAYLNEKLDRERSAFYAETKTQGPHGETQCFLVAVREGNRSKTSQTINSRE
jgi:hypothetical protein